MAHRDTSVSALCRELGIRPVTLYRYVGRARGTVTRELNVGFRPLPQTTRSPTPARRKPRDSKRASHTRPASQACGPPALLHRLRPKRSLHRSPQPRRSGRRVHGRRGRPLNLRVWTESVRRASIVGCERLRQRTALFVGGRIAATPAGCPTRWPVAVVRVRRTTPPGGRGGWPGSRARLRGRRPCRAGCTVNTPSTHPVPMVCSTAPRRRA